MALRSKRLEVISNLKALQEKNALEVLGLSQRKLNDIQTQIDSLKNYRRDYHNKLLQLGTEGNDVAKIQEFRSFMDKLDKAIAGQEQVKRTLEKEVAQRKQDWELKYQNSRSIEKIHAGALKTEQHQAEKREQKQQDESAARMGRSSSFGINGA